MYSYLYKCYPVKNSVPFQESVSYTITTNDKMSVRMNIRGRRSSRRSKSSSSSSSYNDTRCRRTIPIAKAIAASISISLSISISISILLVTKSILFTEASPHVISDDRVHSLTNTSPALWWGYSITTNGFLPTCLMVDETTVPSYNYDCK